MLQSVFHKYLHFVLQDLLPHSAVAQQPQFLVLGESDLPLPQLAPTVLGRWFQAIRSFLIGYVSIKDFDFYV
jgi:hypothetical protein